MSTQLEEKLNKILAEKKEKILPENIRKGTKIFDVEGGYEGIDTSDADATAADILKDKTAYVNGEKIEGTYEPLDTSDANATADDIMKNKTAYVNGEKIVGTLETDSDSSNNALANTEGFDKIPSTILNPNHFQVAKAIKEIDLSDSDFSEITQYTNAFANCGTMTKLKLPAITGAEITRQMFNFCYILTEAPYFDTSSVTDMYRMFNYCHSLVKVPIYDTSSVSSADSMREMFKNCPSLSDESLNNILVMCISAVNKTNTKSLSILGLTAAQIERCKSLSNWQAFLDAGWAAN